MELLIGIGGKTDEIELAYGPAVGAGYHEVVRAFFVGVHGKVGHQLSEFTHDEIVAMIESAPSDRGQQSAATPPSGPAAPPPAGEVPAAGGMETTET